MFPGVSSTPPSATRLSGSSPDPWFCVAASRRVCPSREGVFPERLICARWVPRQKSFKVRSLGPFAWVLSQIWKDITAKTAKLARA